MNRQLEEAAKFVRLAERDLAAYRILRDSEGADMFSALFHAQQCVEKCFKAILAYREQFIPKINDLLRLVELVEKYYKIPVSES